MSETLQFKVFCLEAYKAENKLTGYETVDLFKKFGVFEYLDKFYEVLHTTGRDYLIQDIKEFIEIREKQRAARNAEYLENLDRSIEQLKTGKGQLHELIEVEEDAQMAIKTKK